MYEFSVYEYLSRIENAALEIQENKKPVDSVIVLWWGLDGLRLNEGGSLEWISRKNKTLPSNGLSPYEGKMEKLRELFQQCCVQYPAQYPAYYYGGCCRLN